MSTRIGLVLIIISLEVASVLPAAAQSAPAAPPAAAATQAAAAAGEDYETLVKKGTLEFNLGHWGEAKAYFLRAHEIRPSARTLRSLGLTCYEQRLYVAALAYFRDALASQTRPLTEEMRTQVVREMEESRSFISYVELSTDPAKVALSVDGQPPVLDHDGSVMLDVGAHELLAEAQGYEPQTRYFTAHGSERIKLRMTLQPAAKAEAAAPEPFVAPPAAAAKQEEGSFWSTRTTSEWVGIGLAAGGVVALGVGTVFSILATSANQDSKNQCVDNKCSQEGLERRDTALTRADIATASFITAGVLLAGGAICYFAIPAERPTTTAWQWSPTLQPGRASLQLSTRF